MRPTLGDDNSSGGLFQLHVGGISNQYPNPGKGDDFINDKFGDDAKSWTPDDKIKYLNAPENQKEISYWVANDIKNNGANAWTVARQQGLFGAKPFKTCPP